VKSHYHASESNSMVSVLFRTFTIMLPQGMSQWLWGSLQVKHLSRVTRNGQEELHQRIQCLVSPNPEHKKVKDKACISKISAVSFFAEYILLRDFSCKVYYEYRINDQWSSTFCELWTCKIRMSFTRTRICSALLCTCSLRLSECNVSDAN